MQSVSSAWITNQEQTIVSESFVELTLTVSDPSAQTAASASDNGSLSYSDTAELVAPDLPTPQIVGTLEANMWPLDGETSVFPQADVYAGYISAALCGDDCVFSSAPTVVITFSETIEGTTPGLTLVWGSQYTGEYAVDYTVTAYNGTTETASTVVSDASGVTQLVSLEMSGYDRIEIAVQKWSLPRHRARMTSVLIGWQRTWTKSDLLSYSHTESSDLLSASLPQNELNFSVSNLDYEYNPDNPEGIGAYLLERQLITARYGYRINGAVEWIDGGRLHLSEWNTPNNGIEASFKAKDIFQFMKETYKGRLSGTLADVVTAAFEASDLPLLDDGSDPWDIDSGLSAIAVPSGIELSNEPTNAEVVQMCANAACMVMWHDRKGVCHIGPLDTAPTDYAITKKVLYSYPETSLANPLKQIIINENYTLNVADKGVEEKVTNPFISAERAATVAEWIKNILTLRQTLTGEWRADPRADALDVVTAVTPFATNSIYLTSVTYAASGSFRGKFEGVVIGSVS